MDRKKLVDALPPFNTEQLNETTNGIIEAVVSNKVTLLKNRANYRTDRPANKNKAGIFHTRGNSESEVSFPFDFGHICNEVGIGSPKICINSLRMYGQISDNPLHFHGFQDPQPENRVEFIIFAIKMISPYDPTTEAVFPSECSRYASKWELSLSPLIFIYEEDKLVKHIEAEVGDMLILPSGVFHEFSCLPSTFVDVSSIEVASCVSILSGGSWTRVNGDTPESVIERTILQEKGFNEKPKSELTLADIPSLKPYINVSTS